VPVIVTPDELTMVDFDRDEIRAITEQLVREIGLPAELDITIDVDDTVLLGGAEITSLDPVVLSLQGGALEDPKRPKQLSRDGTADIIGRLLYRVGDRRDPAFGAPPADDDLSLAQRNAWDVYCIGRLARHGHRAQRQRRLYVFRNRHGFTDAADAAFDRLWSSESLDWSTIASISDGALDGAPAPV
jgi:hypothetical protein